jgi:hypothetical protein
MKTELQEKVTPTRSRAGNGRSSSKSDASKEEMMQKAKAAATPGPAHKALDALIGEWKAEVKCWMEPGQEPHVSQGRAKATWKFNGRFVEEEFHGEMMGQPFVGRTLIGFDNTKQSYDSVWVSDMQTSMFVSEGKGDAANRVITQEGTASCAATGRTDVPMKTVLRLLSPDKHTFEMFDASKGPNAKTMEITYTRQTGRADSASEESMEKAMRRSA